MFEPSDGTSPPPLWARLAIAVALALLAAWECYRRLGAHPELNALDFTYPWRAAAHLLAGRDPYQPRPHAPYTLGGPFLSPLPTAMLVLPVADWPVRTAGTVFTSISVGLLTFALTSRAEVFDTFRKLHPKLKEQYRLNPKEEDADPYESSQFTVLIANRHGLFGVYSYREVFEFERFWAIGSGRSFALGAMYAGYDKLKTAREIASLGVAAGNEFDKNSAAPVRLHTIKLKG